MRYIGLDLGRRTLGVAYSDLSNRIALRDTTYRFNEKDETKQLEQALNYVKIIMEEKNADKVVLGLPKNMDGSIGFQGQFCLTFKELLEKELNVEVFMWDERLSTVEVSRLMSSSDFNTKRQKEHKDILAAVLILQSFLDSQQNK